MTVVNLGTTRHEIEARIERIPLLTWHWLMLGIVGIAQAAEAIDSLAASFALPVLSQAWSLTSTQSGMLISAMYVGQMIGGALIGWLSDHFGRLNLLRWSTIALILIGLAAASAWSFHSFLALRFLQGIAIGGELVTASTYIAELSTGTFRGRLVFGLNIIYSIGVIAASLIASYVVPNFGWRWIFYVAAVTSAPFFLFGRGLPESPRWLLCRGRLREADAIVSQIESHLDPHSRAVVTDRAPVSEAVDIERLGQWRDLFGPGLGTRTLLLWIVSFCVGFVGITLISWLPTLFLKAYAISLRGSLAVSSIIFSATLLGSVCGSIFVDRLTRIQSLTCGFVGLAAAVAVLCAVMGSAPLSIAVASAFVTLLCQVFLLFTLYLTMAEFYPTRLRGVGTGAARVWLGISAIVGPLSVSLVLEERGPKGALALLFAVAVLGLIADVGLALNARRAKRYAPAAALP
jgi:MFS transporter, putative metabolite:H+ symporter